MFGIKQHEVGGINVSSGTMNKGPGFGKHIGPKDAQEHFVGPFTAHRFLPPIDFGETAFCPSSLPDKLSGRSQKQTGKRKVHVKGESWLQIAKQGLKQRQV